ncbi:hypothetical protein GOODEAATRI_028570, partial [Goodea atripinnis]
HFNWRWVAFLNSDDDFGIDGLELFIERIKTINICLAYTKAFSENTDHSQIFKQIEAQKINVIVVFAPKLYAEAVIKNAIQLNVTNKMWIADDKWSLNKVLPKMEGIRSIGTVLGVAQPIVTIPGFDDFIYFTRGQGRKADTDQQTLCNQVCNCGNMTAGNIIAADPSFSFPVYSAVHAVARALHNILECEAGRCNDNISVEPYMHFNWRWVAFLNSDDDFGIDGLELFIERIKTINICLAYTKAFSENTDHSQIFKQIEAQKINVIVVFAPKLYAEAVIKNAIQLNVTNKVWIADDKWSLNKVLPKMEGIRSIGTVLGVAQPIVTIPGFDDFIYFTRGQGRKADTDQQTLCNQACNCGNMTAGNIISADPSFSFPVYSAVHAVARALHNILECEAGRCNDNISVEPYMEVGFYHFNPAPGFYINDTQVQWHTDGEVPIALCSPQCPTGFAKKQTGIHKCCFRCEMCPQETYANITGK